MMMISATSKIGLQPTVYFHGNSLSTLSGGNFQFGMRMPLTAYDTIKASVNCSFQNYSIGGQTTTQLISTFPTKIEPNIKSNDVVFMWEIINDIGATGGKTAQEGYDNVVTYCGLVRAAGARVIVATAIANGTGNDVEKDWVNDQIKTNWASFADALCDLSVLTNFDTVADTLNTTYYNADQVHLTDVGYDEIAGTVATSIITLLQS